VAVRLPLYLAQRFEAHVIRVADQPMIAAVLKGDDLPPPTVLHNQVHRLLDLIGAESDGFCLVAEQLPPYLRRRLVEMRMPFVIPGRQLYWPALGNAETAQRPRRLHPRPVDRFGPATQQLLIAMLLLRLPRPTTVSGAAEALEYTAMSMSRAVKELEGAALIASAEHGRLRTFTLQDSPAAVWAKALPKLRNPVMDMFRVLRRDLPATVSVMAGESALAERSNLVAPQEPVFAVASRVWTRLHRDVRIIPTVDEGTCRLELWRYAPEVTAEEGQVDPLSLLLSLREHPDERVQQALGVMMRQLPW
jgi:DNA-binding MarR family transcriptional regulator